MADALVPAHPLEAWRDALATLPADLEPDAAVLDVRLGCQRSRAADTHRPQLDSVDQATEAGLGTAADALGTPLPALGCWTATGAGQAFRLGPDEWLVTSTTHDAAAWEASVIDALRPLGGTATDVSAQRTGVRLRGDRARELLAFGCSLDLRPRSFPAGRCAQTLFGQVGVLLAAHPDGDVQVLVRTSFAGYLADRLLDAAVALDPEALYPEEIP